MVTGVLIPPNSFILPCQNIKYKVLLNNRRDVEVDGEGKALYSPDNISSSYVYPYQGVSTPTYEKIKQVHIYTILTSTEGAKVTKIELGYNYQ